MGCGIHVERHGTVSPHPVPREGGGQKLLGHLRDVVFALTGETTRAQNELVPRSWIMLKHVVWSLGCITYNI